MDHSQCNHVATNVSVHQTLDELDFERGIWFAAQQNDEERVIKLLKQGINANVEDNSGYTALHYSARNGHLPLCKLLIQYGANVNATTKGIKATPLHRAASAGHLEVFKILLNNGASIQLPDADGKTVLHRAVEGGYADICEFILNYNTSLKEIKDNRGRIPEELIGKNKQLLEKLF